ncbi:hypothetical protein [Variovorax sp. 54]|uniref:hypothetical protein n=1 Tax=Variovorax sp. 54 TaxID=2035212 RepID=UPI0015D4C991|nr:hypothetical protein [Variovorax sp. 54]
MSLAYGTFEDATVRITVEIDNEEFRVGQTVSAEHQCRTGGEFDKGLLKAEFELDRVILLS